MCSENTHSFELLFDNKLYGQGYLLGWQFAHKTVEDVPLRTIDLVICQKWGVVITTSQMVGDNLLSNLRLALITRLENLPISIRAKIEEECWRNFDYFCQGFRAGFS